MCFVLKDTAALQSLDYAYRANGFLRGTNRINTIFDNGTSAGFDEGNAPIFAAYTYDVNGNLSHDPFKNLDIAYNHLNLPDTIIQPGSNNRIVWFYDAAGNKLRKEVLNDSIVLTGPFTENQYRARFITTDGQPTALDSTLLIAQDSIVFKPGFHAQSGMRLTAKIDSTIAPVDQTDYIGGIEYRNGGIEAIYHPAGRAVPDGSTWRHEYVITDHLGNTRLRFSDLDGSGTIDSTELLSTHDYYPFGLEWQDGGYKYTYNGKEIDRELGLNWHHYGKRMYDAVLGRFTGVDPISDQFPWVSTFNYAENEPVANIDLHGLQKANRTASDKFSAFMTDMKDNGFASAVNNLFNFQSLLFGTEQEKAETFEQIEVAKAEGQRVAGIVEESLDEIDNAAATTEEIASTFELTMYGFTAMSGGFSSPVTVPAAAGARVASIGAKATRVGVDYVEDGKVSRKMQRELITTFVFSFTTDAVNKGVTKLNIKGEGASQTEEAIKAINEGVQKIGEEATNKIHEKNN